ncbi:hypothetical protein B0H10DRAFT_2235989 [Mycena sp. CBHHK59/15]|nr:hypothetical protein B0H10DRAFT_2235989 [Mycena sp. CBHHK59/15]
MSGDCNPIAPTLSHVQTTSISSTLLKIPFLLLEVEITALPTERDTGLIRKTDSALDLVLCTMVPLQVANLPSRVSRHYKPLHVFTYGISKLYRTCNSPLPSWCPNGPYPPTSSRTLPLLSELSEPLISVYDGSHNAVQERLSNVFDASLSTVADIRSLVKNYGSARSALPFVLGLVRVLADICAAESMIMTDTSFVRPRRRAPDRGFDGLATMLACHIVTSLSADNSPPINISEESPDPLRSEGSSSSLPPGDPMSVDTKSDSSDAGASSIDLPLEAHVLPGRGRHLFAAIPFLSFADSDNFVDLMSSVACQRYVWGIPEPALGFVLSATGVVMKLVVSWVDLATHVVHISCPDSQQCGVFDFTNPTSTLRFSQLILELSPHLAFATEPFFQNNKLDWRSDNAEISSGNFRSWRDRVAQWVHDVQISREKFPFSRPATPSPSPPARGDGSLASAMPSDPTEPEHPKSSRSSSDFTGLSARSSPRTESAATVAWVLDRAILLATRIPFEVSKASPGDEAIEFSDRLLSYDEMCGHVWPSSWDARALIASTEANNLLIKLSPMLNSPDEVKKLVEHRSRQEPRDGKCDALLFGVIDGQSVDGAEFLISPHSTVPPHQISQSGGFNESLWQNAFHVRVAERAAALAAESGPAYPFAGHLLLPNFVAKYQKLSHDEGQVLIQGRMYLASLVAFYSALGIDDYPFYGLVACGKVGSLLMAWKSSTHKQTYLVEHNVCKFDITVPIEAFQFATFLLRLRDDQQRLKKRVEERLKKGVDRERLRRWTKSAQMSENAHDHAGQTGLPDE